MRLIDADVLKKKAEMRGRCIRPLVTAFQMCVTVHDINNAPTVDAEPVRHGRWIDEYNGKYANPRYICSNCKGNALYGFERDALGNYSEVQVLTEHCPHCGAKMDEEVE